MIIATPSFGTELAAAGSLQFRASVAAALTGPAAEPERE
jgi:hypothetical protein